jgi:hypothetical protein
MRSEQAAIGLLFGFGVLIGLAVAPHRRDLSGCRSQVEHRVAVRP